MQTSQRFSVAGVDIDLLVRGRLLETLDDAITERRKQRVIFCNASTIVEASENPRLREAVGDSDVVVPDGMPLVWLAKLNGEGPIERVDGPGFMRLALEYGVSRGWRHYLYGASEPVIEQLQARIRDEIPGAEVVGWQAPPFREMGAEEDAAAIDSINTARPDIVWIGLGMPKQELWMANHQDDISSPVLAGVGAAFDFHAGSRKRAPIWMQRSGFEWLFRFSEEPRRLWRRYLLGNARFILLAAPNLRAALRLRTGF